MRAACIVLLGACSFSANVPATGDDDPPTDAPPDESDQGIGNVAHVPKAVEDAFAATAAVTITNATIQTRTAGTDPSIDVALPGGASLISSMQDDATGRELAILEVGDLTVTGTLTVRGTRAFVIIARGTITISGTIDGNAVKGTVGPGGYQARGGPGKGNDGLDDATSFDDSGGSGG